MKFNSTFLSAIITAIFHCFTIVTATGTGQDTIAIHNIGHGSVMFEFENIIIHVDPYSSVANYSTLPDADLIFITHGHGDHYDLTAITNIKKDSTLMVCTEQVKNLGSYTDTAIVMNNGDSAEIKGIPVKAVPAYNFIKSYHPKGVGNGYVFTFGEKSIYVAGDTENIPEMDSLGKIDIAFLPMNLPYTMTPEQAADAAIRINPDILYIYHFGTSDTAYLRSLLSEHKNIKVRIGKSVYYEKTVREPGGPSNVLDDEIKRISVSPNPVKDYLIIRNHLSDLQFSVFSTNGQLIVNKQFNAAGEELFDLRSLKPGVYILQINDNHSVRSEVLIKE